jgi:uncharacterized membrane protein
MNREQLSKLTLAGLFAAMAFICFSYLRLEIPMGLGMTGKFYIGHTFIMLSALLLGVKYGALSGAVGLTIGDVLAGYTTSAPPTFVAKFILGATVAIIAHKVFHLTQETSGKKINFIILVSTIVGSLVNVVTEPLARFSFKYFVLGWEKYVAYVSAMNCAVTEATGDFFSVILCFVLYNALERSVLRNWKFEM